MGASLINSNSSDNKETLCPTFWSAPPPLWWVNGSLCPRKPGGHLSLTVTVWRRHLRKPPPQPDCAPAVLGLGASVGLGGEAEVLDDASTPHTTGKKPVAGAVIAGDRHSHPVHLWMETPRLPLPLGTSGLLQGGEPSTHAPGLLSVSAWYFPIAQDWNCYFKS